MKEFFKGRRRKVGCVTLVMACVVTAGLIRSNDSHDEVHLVIASNLFEIESFAGRLQFQTIYSLDIDRFANDRFWTVYPYPDAVPPVVGSPAKEPWLQYHYAPAYGDGETFVFFRFPYWFLLLPLTMLSAYLLLSKPRPATTTKSTEPVPAEAP